ncbi:hypothetical protein GF325_02120 [Candidatus Bathyarchaeota archaeon]|nr:hypothetical protein [Candidatus Bathyarchaeota archaeon]
MNNKRHATIGFVLLFFLSVMAGCMTPVLAGTFHSGGKLSVEISQDDPVSFGALNVRSDLHNLEISGNAPGYHALINEDFTFLDAIPSTHQDPILNYPARFGTRIEGFDPRQPSSSVRWVMSTNSTYINTPGFGIEDNFGSYQYRLVDSRITVNPGNKKLVDINHSLSVFNVISHLEAHYAYLFMITQISGNFVTSLPGGNPTIIGPQGYTLQVAGDYNIPGTNIYYYVFVPKYSGRHLIAFRNTFSPGVSAYFEMKKIPRKGLTSGQLHIGGDDPLSSIDPGKKFSYYSFSHSISSREGYSYEISSIGGSVRQLIAYPNEQVYSVTTDPSDHRISNGNGKVLMIAIEEIWQDVVTHYARFDKDEMLNQKIGTTKIHQVKAFEYAHLKITTSKDMVIRINASTLTIGSTSIEGLYRITPDHGVSWLPYIATGFYTSSHDLAYFCPKGTYIMSLDNHLTSYNVLINMSITELKGAIYGEKLQPWEGVYNSSGSNDWEPIDQSLYNTYEFENVLDDHGSLVPRVFRFTVEEFTYMRLHSEIEISENPFLNSSNTSAISIYYCIMGPNNFYPNKKYLYNYGDDGATLTFSNASSASARQFETNLFTFFVPGEYCIFAAPYELADLTWSEYLNDSLVLSMRLEDCGSRIYRDTINLGSAEPEFHAGGPGGTDDGFDLGNDGLNFSESFNDISDYSHQYTNHNDDMHEYGMLLRVKNGKQYGWTQLVAMFENCQDLEESPVPNTLYDYGGGINFIFPDPNWKINGPVGPYNYVPFVSTGSNYMRGQFIDNGNNGYYSVEFGAFERDFYIYFNPDGDGSSDDFNMTIGIELAQYDTPVVNSGPGIIKKGFELGLWGWTGVIAAAVGVVVVATVIYRKKKHRI